MNVLAFTLVGLAWLPAAIGAAEVTPPLASNAIQVTASSTWGEMNPHHVTNGAGLKDLLHDNNPESSGTMWHTAGAPKPTRPAEGLPEAPAWLRFDFKQAWTPGSCVIWNHNQANLTNRGFNHTLAFASTDGKTWEAVKSGGQEVFIIPEAKGSTAEPSHFTLALPRKSIVSLILMARDNHGGNVTGLSEVRFLQAPITTGDVPKPSTLTATGFPFLSDENGGWQRQVSLYTGDVPVYEAAEIIVACNGATATTRLEPSAQGSQTLTANLPPGKGNKRSSTDQLNITLKIGAWTKILQSAIEPPKQWPDLEEVIVTFKCHLDIGYTHSVPEVIEKYRTHDMDKILAVFEETKDLPKDDRFLWMLPAWAMEIALDEKQTPERRMRLEQAVKDGRLLWHALPYTFESEASDAEELVRALGYATRLAKRFNLPMPTEAKQTDMPDQAWVLPTLLKNAGIKFLHIGANPGSKPTAELSKIPTLCWWEGPDGSRVLLGYSPQYGWDHVQPPANWPHKSWLAFFVLGDNAGPPPASAIKNVLEQARKQLPGVKIRFGRPSDFADSIINSEKENPILPVVRGDMPDTWTHGQMSCPPATATHRRASTQMGSLGILDSTIRAWGLTAPPVAASLAEAYALGGFYGEHTWGIAGGGFRGTYGEAWKNKYQKGDYKKFEDTYQYHMDYGRKAGAIADREIAARMTVLAQGVKVDGPRVVVFNPLPWVRNSPVAVQLPSTQGSLSSVTDFIAGKAVPFTLDHDRMLRFEARDLPPGGYRTYGLHFREDATVASSTAIPLQNNTLETAHFTAKFDLERGGIVSLIDKASGRELVDAGQHVLGQFMHERFSITQVNKFVKTYGRTEAGGWVWGDFGKAGMPDEKTSPYLARTPKAWTANTTSTQLGETVTLMPSDTLGLAKSYAVKFTFPSGNNCVDIAWSVDGKTPDPIPEAGWLCLPFKVESPSFRVGRVGGTIDPAKDIIFGSNHRLPSVDRGITVRAGESGAGIAAASADLPLWSLGEPGMWQYSPTYVPTKPGLFVNLYNNMWNTNYPLWIGGSWNVSLRFWPVAEKATEEQALFTPSWEVRQPVLVGFADGNAGNLPALQSGIALSRKGTRVTAFCPNPDGEGTILRLWEQAGENGEITVILPQGFTATRARPVNLRGETSGDSLDVKNSRFTGQLRAWAPASWVLE